MEMFADSTGYVPYEKLPFTVINEEDLTLKVLEHNTGTEYKYYFVTGEPMMSDIRSELGNGDFVYVNLMNVTSVKNLLNEYETGSYLEGFMGLLTAKHELIIDKRENLEAWVGNGDIAIHFLVFNGQRTLEDSGGVAFRRSKTGIELRPIYTYEVLSRVPREYMIGTKVLLSSGLGLEFVSQLGAKVSTTPELNSKVMARYMFAEGDEEHIRIRHFPLPIRYCGRGTGRLNGKATVLLNIDGTLQIRMPEEMHPSYKDFFNGEVPMLTKDDRLMTVYNF